VKKLINLYSLAVHRLVYDYDDDDDDAAAAAAAAADDDDDG